MEPIILKNKTYYAAKMGESRANLYVDAVEDYNDALKAYYEAQEELGNANKWYLKQWERLLEETGRLLKLKMEFAFYE
jgi:hypothetical protein